MEQERSKQTNKSGMNLKNHRYLVFLAKNKLRSMGYEVYERDKRLRMRTKERGLYYSSLSQVDVYAERDREPVVVEVYCGGLVDQLQRYKKLGKVILVLPMDVEGIQLWGIKELEGHRTYPKDSNV